MPTFFLTLLAAPRRRRQRPLAHSAQAGTTTVLHRHGPARLDVRAEDGLLLLEVLISALIVGLIVVGTFTGIDVAQSTSISERDHNEAILLSSESQESLRSAPASTFDSSTGVWEHAYTKSINGETYSVTQKASFLNSGGEAAACSATNTTRQETNSLRLASVVSWPQQEAQERLHGNDPPVTVSSVTTPPAASALEVDVGNYPDAHGRCRRGTSDDQVHRQRLGRRRKPQRHNRIPRLRCLLGRASDLGQGRNRRKGGLRRPERLIQVADQGSHDRPQPHDPLPGYAQRRRRDQGGTALQELAHLQPPAQRVQHHKHRKRHGRHGRRCQPVDGILAELRDRQREGRNVERRNLHAGVRHHHHREQHHRERNVGHVDHDSDRNRRHEIPERQPVPLSSAWRVGCVRRRVHRQQPAHTQCHDRRIHRRCHRRHDTVGQSPGLIHEAKRLHHRERGEHPGLRRSDRLSRHAHEHGVQRPYP